MNRLHQTLTQKYPKYNNWHQIKHHNTIHWGVLAVFTLLVFGTISRWTPISFAADTTAPTTPTSLTATPISSSQINLSWTASTDDVGVTGYKIYRCAGSACAPTTQIATSAINSYSNTGLTASTAYTYAVSAYDAAGNESGWSTSVSATTNQSGVIFEDNTVNTWTEYTSDPATYHMGWTTAHWASGINKMLVWGGDSHNSFGSNSVRAFDPVTNTWEILYPNNNGAAGLQNRDNHISFYVPNQGVEGEFWVLSGSTGQFMGRFDLSTRTWVALYQSPTDANPFIKDMGTFFHQENAASDWCPELNTGVMFGGDSYGTPSNYARIIEPNPQGPEPYRYWFDWGTLPGNPGPNGRTQNQGICVGKYFYVYGGSLLGNQLWRLDVPARQWTQLAPGLVGGWHGVLTYDSKNNVLIASGFGIKEIQAYHIDTNIWELMPVAEGALNRGNHVGIYSHTVNQHIYEGGNVYLDDGTPTIGRNTMGYTYANGTNVPPPTSDTTPPSIPTNLTATVVSSSQIDLIWMASTDNVGVTGYKIFRNGIQIATSQAASYSDTGLLPSTTYSYTIAAYDAAGNISSQSTLASATTQVVDITTGLVGFWKFDEGTGTTAQDSSGNSNNATLINGPTWTTGKIGKALSFDGVDDYVSIPDNLIKDKAVLTVVAWIKMNTNGVVIGYQNTAYPINPSSWVPALYVGTDGKLQGEFWQGAVTPIAGNSAINDGIWHHVALVGNTNTQSLYLDGTLVGTLPGNINHLTMSKNQIGLGYTAGSWPNGNGGWFYFSGSIDEIRIYNRALSATEVQTIFEIEGATLDDTTPPSIPTNPRATVVSSSRIDLIWMASTDNVGVTGYKIFRKGIQIATSQAASYSDTGLLPSTTYSYTIAAYDAAGNTSQQSESVSATTLPTTSWIDIPLNTWVTIPLPGYGKAPWGQMKHMRLAYNPVNSRIYFLGGDYSGPISPRDSGRNEVYSYSIVDNNWIQEQPYCRANGEVQPEHPDEVGWVYDTKHNIFWMIPGFLFAQQGEQESCPTANYSQEIVTFNPATREWTVAGVANTPIIDNAINKFAQYDPVTDTIVRLTYDGGAGTGVAVYDITNNKWTLKRDYRLSLDFAFNWTAMDSEGRHIYVLEGGSLYQYHMDTQAIVNLGKAPGPGVGIPVWDSINNVLIITGDETLYVYHPNTKQWEVRIPTNPTAFAPIALTNHAVFDPQQNMLLVMGGLTDSFELTANPNLFLYRYGIGTSGVPIPIDNQAPTTPTNVQSTTTTSSQINLSWSVSTDNVGVTGYKIYRCAGSACAPTVQIATSAVNSYSNTGLTASTAYTYSVSAYDAAGNESGKSASVPATTLSQFKQADFNKDGVVNQLDFDILKQEWSRTDKPVSDLNQDGIVDARDLGIMMSQWSK